MADNLSRPIGRPGGGSPGTTAGSSGNGTPRSRDEELAGTVDVGGARIVRGPAKSGGGQRARTDVFTYKDPTNRDPDRTAMALETPGSGKGGGAGSTRDNGTGREATGSTRSASNTRPGKGLGSDAGGNVGGSARRGRGGDDTAGGGGGSGGGAGGGRGRGTGGGQGNGGGGSGGRPRMAGGGVFGDPNGARNGGDANGGGGTGNGPGGPGNKGRLASGGKGSGGGTGDSDGPGGLGRGTGGRGTGSGKGIGNGSGTGNGTGKGKGREGTEDTAGNGSGGRGGSRTGTGKGPSKQYEEGDLIGRGVYGKWTVKYFQDKSDHPDTLGAGFAADHPIDWPVFTKEIATTKEEKLDFKWGEKPPIAGMKNTFWSARMTGIIFVPKDDDYWFYFDELDDAGRLVLDGDELFKVWKVQKSTPSNVNPVKLKRGEHTIVIEYIQGPATEASITLSWKSSSFPKEVVGDYRAPN